MPDLADTWNAVAGVLSSNAAFLKVCGFITLLTVLFGRDRVGGWIEAVGRWFMAFKVGGPNGGSQP